MVCQQFWVKICLMNNNTSLQIGTPKQKIRKRKRQRPKKIVLKTNDTIKTKTF